MFLEKKPSWLAKLATQIARKQQGDDTDAAGDVFTRIARDRRAVFAQVLGDMRRMSHGAAIQARCLECAAMGPVAPSPADTRLMDAVLAKLAL